MKRINYSFAKNTLLPNGTPDYAPAILRVVIHHHDEWQEVTNAEDVDENGAEPQYETHSHDWDTYETKIRPTASDYKKMNYLPVVDKFPADPASKGHHYAAFGWIVDDTAVRRTYVEVEDPMPTLSQYDDAMESHLRQEREARGYTTREPDSYLASNVQRWAQDAQDWVAHRDEVMEYALQLINEVQAGTRQPPSMEEFVAGLPKITWTIAES